MPLTPSVGLVESVWSLGRWALSANILLLVPRTAETRMPSFRPLADVWRMSVFRQLAQWRDFFILFPPHDGQNVVVMES